MSLRPGSKARIPALKSAVSIGLIVFFLWQVELTKIWAALARLPFVTIATVSLFYVGLCLLASLSWWVLLPELQFHKLLIFSMIGRYYAFIIPGQVGGDIMKAYLLGRRHEDAEKIAASVILDKLLTTCCAVSIGAVGYGLSAHRPNPGVLYVLLFMLAVIVFIIILIFSKIINSFSSTLIKFTQQRLKTVNFFSRLGRIVDAFRLYSSRCELILINLAISLAYLLLGQAAQILLARSLGIFIPFADWCWILALVFVSSFAPISLAGLGVREGFFIYTLGYFGVSRETALALSFAIFSYVIALALIGALIEARRHMDSQHPSI